MHASLVNAHGLGGKPTPVPPWVGPRSFRSNKAAKANTLMYAGLPRDWATGLIRMGARWYDPTIGRFTQADPSGQEMDAYMYAGGNPVNMVDPTGLFNRAGAAVAGVIGLVGIATLAAVPAAGFIEASIVSGAFGAVGGAAGEAMDPTASRGSVAKSSVWGMGFGFLGSYIPGAMAFRAAL